MSSVEVMNPVRYSSYVKSSSKLGKMESHLLRISSEGMYHSRYYTRLEVYHRDSRMLHSLLSWLLTTSAQSP